MGKFLAVTLIGLYSLVNPALADGFSFTDTYYSEWTGEGSVWVTIVNNPEDDYIHVVDSKKSKDIFCYSKEKQPTKAVFLCGKQEVEARYAGGVVYFNDAPYTRVN